MRDVCASTVSGGCPRRLHLRGAYHLPALQRTATAFETDGRFQIGVAKGLSLVVDHKRFGWRASPIILLVTLVVIGGCRPEQPRSDLVTPPTAISPTATPTAGQVISEGPAATPTTAAASPTAPRTPSATPTTAAASPTAPRTPTATPTALPISPSPTPPRSPTPAAPTITIGDAVFELEIARTLAERVRGLSGRDTLPPMTGMLFLFETDRASDFWMSGMRFPLDFVWIGEECAVVDITLNAPPPAPGGNQSELAIYASAVPATYTLEINAGELESLGIQVGDKVRFSGFSAGAASC